MWSMPVVVTETENDSVNQKLHCKNDVGASPSNVVGRRQGS